LSFYFDHFFFRFCFEIVESLVIAPWTRIPINLEIKVQKQFLSDSGMKK
jgi:hypothetical protein